MSPQLPLLLTVGEAADLLRTAVWRRVAQELRELWGCAAEAANDGACPLDEEAEYFSTFGDESE